MSDSLDRFLQFSIGHELCFTSTSDLDAQMDDAADGVVHVTVRCVGCNASLSLDFTLSDTSGDRDSIMARIQRVRAKEPVQ